MTREEVENIVRGITDKIEATTDIDDWAEFWGFTKDDYEEFLEMAIKALEQESCGDAISRQAVNTLVDELARAISDERGCMSRGRSTATIMRDILDLPPANQQEPKTGHWIRWYEKKDFGLYIENIPHCKCSECDTEYDPYSSQFIKYCNECGAKMEEQKPN